MTVHTLNDGTQIEESTRKGNRSGYTGAALSVDWTLDPDKPFIAACGNPADPVIKGQLRHQERTSWHGGSYADAREAAYVVSKFKQDPVATDRYVEQRGRFDEFPQDLYTLPPGLPTAQAVDYLTKKKLEKKAKRVQVTIKLDPRLPAQGNLSRFYSIESIRAAAKSAGGPDKFQAALVGVNVVEAAVKFNLTVKA